VPGSESITDKKTLRHLQFWSFRRINPATFRFEDFIHPLRLAGRITVLIPAIAYAITFGFSVVLVPVELPAVLQEKFGLSTSALGLQFLGLLIGSLLGEQLGGSMSDMWMYWATRRNGRRPEPEFRLWLSYPGFLIAIAGLTVFLTEAQFSPAGHWSVTPVIGTAISGFGNQVITTVLITYAVDCNPDEAVSVGVFATVMKQVWGFIGPFW
jgi:hypothetical protein